MPDPTDTLSELPYPVEDILAAIEQVIRATCEFQHNLRRESLASRETRSLANTNPVRKIQHNLRKSPRFQRNLRKGPSTQITGEQLGFSSVSSVRRKDKLLNFFSTYVGIFGDSRVTLEFTATTKAYGYRHLSDIGQHLHQEYPDFRPADYGCKTLLRFVESHPERFKVKWSAPAKKGASHVWVRLPLNPSAKKVMPL